MAQRARPCHAYASAWKAGDIFDADASLITAYISKDAATPAVASTNPVTKIVLPDLLKPRFAVLLTANERTSNSTLVAFYSSESGVRMGDSVIINDTLQGANPVTITVLTSLGVPVVGMQVSIKDNAATNVLCSCLTDAAGVARLVGTTDLPYLDDSPALTPYKVVCYKGGAQTANPTDLLVSGGTALAITATVLSPTAPTAGCQTIYGTVKHGDLSGALGAKILAIPVDENQIVGGVFLTLKTVEDTANSVGYFSNLQLIKGGKYNVFELWGGVQHFYGQITVTSDVDTKDLSTYTFTR